MDLRVVPLDEFADPILAHVGNMDVGDAPSGRIVNPLPVLLDHLEIHEVRLVADRIEGHLATRIALGGSAQRQGHRAIRLVTEELIGSVCAVSGSPSISST
jgi:hypothetical protein